MSQVRVELRFIFRDPYGEFGDFPCSVACVMNVANVKPWFRRENVASLEISLDI